MKKLENKFKIKNPKDWLHMNVNHFRRKGGYSLFKLYPSFLDLLKSGIIFIFFSINLL